MSNCTGPALAVRDPLAAAKTRHVAERQCGFWASIFSEPSSARPMLIAART
ncbi:Uncharacterised protein [Mycobacteroides abscessus subsp. abscessus]|nr:Uncharacterised protein [Mycobacteroides abscessus subsp. abscessus]